MALKKKSQVTVFIIIGVVILLAIGLAFLIKGILNYEKPPTPGTENEDVRAVVEFVDTCLNRIAKEGIKRIGAQGGYIDSEKAGLYAVPGMPTISNSLEIAPGSGILIPYWVYMSSANSCSSDCQFMSERPILYSATGGSSSIEAQLEEYINENIDSCVSGLEQYKDRFDITINGNLASKVSVTEKNVLITASYPVDISSDTFSTSLSDEFQTVVDVDLKRMYDLASDVALTQMNNDYKFLEKMTRTLISAYSAVPGSELPPIAGDFSLGFSAIKTWRESKAKEELQNHLASEVSFMQIAGARESVMMFDPDDAMFTAMYKNMMIPLPTTSLEDLRDVKIDFNYLPWWNAYLDVSPSAGDLIMPKRQQFNVLFFLPIQMTDYTFSYDVSYPVLVTLYDPYAFNNEGFTFQFAIEVNMRNNVPLTSDMQAFDGGSVDATFFSSPYQRNSGIITIKTEDESGAPLPKVMLSYVCGDEELYLGESAIEGSNAVLKTTVPLCVDGFVSGYIEDYFVKSSPLSVSKVNKTANVVVKAERILTKKMGIAIKTVEKTCSMANMNLVCGWDMPAQNEVDLHPDEDLMLIMSRKQNPGEGEFIKFLNLNGTNERDAEVELVSGSYTIEGFLMRRLGENYSLDKVVIPPEEICYDTEPMNPFGGEECTTVPEMVFNETLYRGGIRLSDTNGGYYNISVNDIKNNDEITVYLVAPDYEDYEKAEDLEQMGKIDEYSVTYRQLLLPTWSRS